MLLPIDRIKPDENQPRRTFNEEKMEALRASMRDNGFRKDYPIIVNGGNIIVDGERRWRAAKAVGLKEVPVEVKHVNDWERLLYQLQSEGAELTPADRLEAWYHLFKKSKKSLVFLASKLGVSEDTFGASIRDYQSYLDALVSLPKSEKFSDLKENKRFWPLTVIGKEKDPEVRKKLAEKAVKEDWTTDKAREIRSAIEKRPARVKQILEQDYSDPIDEETGKRHEGSRQWKFRLEVATSDVDIDQLQEVQKNTDRLFKQVDDYDDLMRTLLHLKGALQNFDYKMAPTEIRVKLHQNITVIAPFLTDYLSELENYMISQGELEKNKVKKLK